MRPRRGSSALLFSLSEFAYILFFLCLGALVLLYANHRQSLQDISALKEEVNFLNEVLAEKENAIAMVGIETKWS